MTELAAQPIAHYTCRICHASLVPILSLGHQALSDFPASAGTRAHPAVPLELARCTAPTCGLVQLVHTTPREWLYQQYWYRSGVNETMRAELKDVVESGLARVATNRHLTVADIGANDGTLLSLYPAALEAHGAHGYSRVAWEPAKNLYEACRPHAEVCSPEFFHASASEWHGQVHLLTMIACFYDIEDPHQLVGDVANLLHKTGVWIVQQAYLPDMLDAVGYDNICHEHLEYYHLAPMEALLAAHGLEVFHVERRQINGGSFRAYIGWQGRHEIDPSVARMRAEERERFADPAALWQAFAHLTNQRQAELMVAVDLIAEFGPVDVYGASTKGNTLLQACHLDARMIRQAWERSPEKIGRYISVTGIPIVSEEAGRREPPAALLVLPWGFRQAFVAREQGYLATGGPVIFPLPQVEVVTAAGVIA